MRERLKFNQQTVFLCVCGGLVLLYGAKMIAVIGTPDRLSCDQPNAVATADVVIYGASWCHSCTKTGWFLEDRNISYCEYDIEQSADGKAQFAAMGGRGIPVVIVNDVQRVDGYNEQRLMGALHQQGLL